MKKKYLVLTFLLLSYLGYSQITFNGCHPWFENQNFTFTNIGSDATGRNIFETTPINGDQSCGGLGTCEFRIYWSESNNQWEFTADSGNGDFIDPYLIFTNTNPSTPNPPSLTLGTWVEEVNITDGGCEGNLTASNAVLIGDVQDTTLSFADNNLSANIHLSPNPAHDYVSLSDSENKILRLEIYDISGKLILKESSVKNAINISYLTDGLYFVKLFGDESTFIKKLIKQ